MTTTGLKLIPWRGGKRMCLPDSAKNEIGFDEEFGRRRLLDFLYSSCPNGFKTSGGVPCCICQNCKSTYWAKRHLSRNLVKFQVLGSSKIVMCVKQKSCERVRIVRHGNEVNVLMTGSDIWSGPFEVQSGDILKFLDSSPEGNHLEFELLHVDRAPPLHGPHFDQEHDDILDDDGDSICTQSGEEVPKLPAVKHDISNLKLDAVFDCSKVIQKIERKFRKSDDRVCGAKDDPEVATKPKKSYDERETQITSRSGSSKDFATSTSLGQDQLMKSCENSQALLTGSSEAPKQVLVQKNSQDNAGQQPKVNDGPLSMNTSNFVLFFVPLGSDMHTTHINGHGSLEGLRTHVERRGARVLDHFDRNHPPFPTHFVISDRALSSDMAIVEKLGFSTRQEFCEFLGQHGILCVYRRWANRGDRVNVVPFRDPSMRDQYHGLYPIKKRSSDKTDTAINLCCKRARVDESVEKNKELSDLFKELSKFYQAAPTEENDDWRAYSFNMIAGRLRHLPFTIKNDPVLLKRLRGTKGFGDTTLSIIEEFLETGTCQRFTDLKNSMRRKAMLAMMEIWGVGRKRALSLVNEGYKRIGSVRQALNNGRLKLERNQYIGVLCYEDILERMGRNEVEAIAQIVFAAVQQRYPSAEITIMGSYRRGKETCGDVDILITHPDYVESVPPRALGKIVDDLRSAGHVEHHLTFISGMKPGKFESLDRSVAQKLINPTTFGRKKEKKSKDTSSSWMGVMKSPVVANKRRRVDIKFYPYAERVFASLYFTGNGHFNRSMRLWATRKKGWKLSDHGLIDVETKSSVFDKPPQTEEEVFKMLGIRWKEPDGRDCFDAVECVESGRTVSMMLDDMTKAELRAEETDHKWIN